MLARLAAQSKSRPDLSFGRALLVAALIGFWMLAISARLVFLQVSEHNGLADRAHQQQQNAIETIPQRGELLDRQERELARSVETVSLFVDPSGFKQSGDMQCTADYLSAALGLKYSDLTRQFQQAQAEGRKFLWIARRLDAEQGDRIMALNLPGLESRKEPKRYYPNGSLAAHVLGFVGLDGKGLSGLEQSYNTKVAGDPGKLFVEKDANGKPYESSEMASKPGQTIVLTIDISIQYTAEQAIQAAVERSHAKSGSAIVLDPHNSDILALANAPTFDPNNLGKAEASTSRNWALDNTYDPASTFKCE